MPVHQLSDLATRNPAPRPWVDIKPNLPWGDPEFSKRMLREHLDASHDLASRRPLVLNSQIAWVIGSILKPRNARTILDLTCGPGLWANGLAGQGYIVRGIDIAPAAIDYARKTAGDEHLPTTFLQADIREAAYGSGYDAALFGYGEANTLKWEEFSEVLLRVREALNPGGVLMLELIHPDAMERMAGTKWQTKGGGLFGDSPYLWLTESFWNPDECTGCMRHYVIDLDTARVREYGVSYQCYRRDDIRSFLAACGFDTVAEYDSMTGAVGLDDPEWHVIAAERRKTEADAI